MSMMDAQTFRRNLQIILGLPERKKNQSSDDFAPRILSQTGGVNFGGVDDLLPDLIDVSDEDADEPPHWVLPDFCNLYLPDDVGGQCYCLRGHLEGYYPCPEYYKHVNNWTRDDWVDQVEKYVAATIKFYHSKGLKDEYNINLNRVKITGWHEILTQIERFEQSVNNDDFKKISSVIKRLMSDMRDFKPVRATMENSDGFRAGFLDTDELHEENQHGSYFQSAGLWEYETSITIGRYIVRFVLKKSRMGKLRVETYEFAEFSLDFDFVDVPRLPTWVKLEPPIEPDCIALRIENRGFYAFCTIDKRIPDFFKNQVHRTLTMADEQGNPVKLTAMLDWGVSVIYKNWQILLNIEFVPVDAVYLAEKIKQPDGESEADSESNNDKSNNDESNSEPVG